MNENWNKYRCRYCHEWLDLDNYVLHQIKHNKQGDHITAPPEDGSELERELIEYCRSRLADVKCPRAIDFRTELPRHETGKLYKRLLVDEYAAADSRRR